MRTRKKNVIRISLIIGIFLALSISLVSAVYMRSNVQYTQSGTGGLFGGGESFDKSVCKAGQDFVIQIAPFGCTPAVVRSDLLEEQNVPVFCQLGATQINPLINVEAIESISFSGDYPKEVQGIGFHPAKAALGVKGELNSPVLNNIGYVVIVLKKQKNESTMPDFVEGNLTAKIKYDIENAFGVGKASFYLPEFTDEQWGGKYVQYGFWNSKGFLRAEEVDVDRAIISVYDNSLRRISAVNLEKGQTSGEIFLPGFDFCQGSLQLRLDGLEVPDTRAKLRINADVVEVAELEKFLDNKCDVRKIEKQGFVQTVRIRCKEDEKSRTFDLKIEPKVKLSINGEKVKCDGQEECGVGDIIYEFSEAGEKRIFLGYIGETFDGKSFIVPVVSTARDKEQFLDSFVYKNLPAFVKTVLLARDKGVLTEFVGGVLSVIGGSGGTLISFIATGSYPLGLYYEGKIGLEKVDFGSRKFIASISSAIPKIIDLLSGIEILRIEFVGFALSGDKKLDEQTQKNYENAMEDYNAIIEHYSGEEYPEDSPTTLAEEALYNKIILARDLGQKRTLIEFCGEFKERYPKSGKNLKDCEDDYRLSSSETASEFVLINGRDNKISFDGIYEPSLSEFSAGILISNAGNYSGPATLGKNQQIFLSEDESIILKDLQDDFAVFDVRGVEHGLLKELTYTPENLRIDLNDYRVIGMGKYKVSLTKINLQKSAKVSVIPKINNVGTEANFGFKIGIEKRGIQLSPERTKEIIESLNESIENWEDISEGLGKAVEIGKAACIGTGAALTVKNFFASLGGKGIARQTIMRGKDGWYERCADLVNNNTYVSQEQCLIKNADEIDRDVEDYYKIMEEQNKEIKKIEDKFSERKFLTEKAVNTDEFMKNYSKQVQGTLVTLGDSFADPKAKGAAVNMEDIRKTLSYEGWKNGIYDSEQLREIELYTKILKENPGDERARQRLYSLFSEVQSASGNFVERSSLQSDVNGAGFNIEVSSYGDERAIKGVYGGGTVLGSQFSKEWEGRENNVKYPTEIITYQGKKYILILKATKGSEYIVDKAYEYNGISGGKIQLGEEKTGFIATGFSMFRKYDSSTYENEFKNPRVRYYETEPYKGFPAIVPFDLNKGWYAATKQTLPVGNIGTFDASARVNSFYLCNVGENGLEEFYSGFGDDICEGINLGTGQPYNQFPGLEEKEASRLVSQGVNAIKEASQKYGKGVKEVVIRGQRIKVGEPAVDVPEIQCQDFMSPKDCNLIFNVCDPVICPSSRCDFGGEYPVRDVIQSGVVGGLLLCLPNWHEGIYVPVCLTGIKAGIDGYLSIQNSYRDCLQSSLDTGESIGICDEIHSIYMCEFFWRQALPLANIAIPKIMEVLSGQNVRGGGEYLGVSNAWESAKGSANYFTQYYGANSYKAFKARSTEDIVTTAFCKNFNSLVAPETGNLFDSLIEPDSPPQFHGRFDEIPFTTVTVPPTSHYKVFYHIYAGKDSGAYYSVYLRGGAESAFYQDVTATRAVASGYIPVGGYASETKDFTAPSGYKELCINVNGQEECGFREISTSFALDYIKDQYLASQAKETDIKTEAGCISGSASLYSLLSPNIQEGAEGLINPEIYNRGIIRICATDNPGRGSDARAGTEESRWVEVGYCGDKKLKCWLDTESVKKAIEFTSIEEGALQEVTKDYISVLINKEGYLEEDEFESAIDKIEDEKDSQKKIGLISGIIDKVFFNHQKAYLLLLKGNAYMELALKGIKGMVKGETALSEANKTVEKKSEEMLEYCSDEVVLSRGGYETVEDCLKDFFGIENMEELKEKAGEIALTWVGCEIYDADKKIRLYECYPYSCDKAKEIYVKSYQVTQKGSYLFKEECEKEGEIEEKEFLGPLDFISPIFEFEDGKLTTNLFYVYSEKGWYWSPDKTNWMNVSTTIVRGGKLDGDEPVAENKEFIKSLEQKSFLEGLRLLIDRTVRESEGKIAFKPKLSTEYADMNSAQEFTFRYKKDNLPPEVFYFKFSNEKWLWKSQRDEGDGWIIAPKIVAGGGFYGEPVDLIKSLEELSFYEGAENIFSKTTEIGGEDIAFFNDFIEYYRKCANLGFSQACSCGGFDYNQIPADYKILIEGDDEKRSVAISLLKKESYLLVLSRFKNVEERKIENRILCAYVPSREENKIEILNNLEIEKESMDHGKGNIFAREGNIFLMKYSRLHICFSVVNLENYDRFKELNPCI